MEYTHRKYTIMVVCDGRVVKVHNYVFKFLLSYWNISFSLSSLYLEREQRLEKLSTICAHLRFNCF